MIPTRSLISFDVNDNLYTLQREFFIDDLLVRIHFIIVIIRLTGLAPWEFEFPFSVSFTSNFLELLHSQQEDGMIPTRSLISFDKGSLWKPIKAPTHDHKVRSFIIYI